MPTALGEQGTWVLFWSLPAAQLRHSHFGPNPKVRSRSALQVPSSRVRGFSYGFLDLAARER